MKKKKIIPTLSSSIPNILSLSQINEQAYKKHLSAKIQFYRPHDKQAQFHGRPEYCRVILGGNRCLGGETKIYDPVLNAENRIDEIDDDFHVLAWTGSELVCAEAKKPFKKDVDSLYRISLSDGSSFVASMSHLVLTSQGWRSLSQLSVGASLFRPSSSSDISPSTRALSDLRFSQKAQGSQYDCRSFSHSYGGPLLRDVNNAQYVFPLRGGAQEHICECGCNPSSSRRDDPDSRLGCIRPYPYDGPPSIEDVPGRHVAPFSAPLSQIACRPLRSPDYGGPASPQPTASSCRHSQSKNGSVLDEESNLSYSRSPYAITSYLEIIDIGYVRDDVKWDLHVPIYNNYLASGVIHHNSGKSQAIISEAISYAMGERPWDGTKTRHPPSKVLIGCTNFLHSAKTEVVPTIEKLLPEKLIASVNFVHQGIPGTYNLTNGSIISLYSYRQEENTVEGGDWDFIACNEPPPEWFVTGLERGLIDRGGRIVFGMTPLSEPWINDKIVERCGHDKDYWCIYMSQDDNPYLGEEEKRRFRSKLSPEEAEARIFGRPRYLMGRVYKDYSLDVHFLDRAKYFDSLLKAGENFSDYPKGMAIDPHHKKPFAMIWYAVNPKNQIIVFDEWPNQSYYEYREQHSLDDFAKIIQEKEETIPGGPASIKWRSLDPNYGRTPSLRTGKNLEDDFVDFGLIFQTNFSNSLDIGHLAIREKLRSKEREEPSLFILNNCHNLHASMMRYSYDEQSNGEKVREEFKDFADALRYAIVPNPIWENPKDEFNRRSRMIERLKASRRSW